MSAILNDWVNGFLAVKPKPLIFGGPQVELVFSETTRDALRKLGLNPVPDGKLRLQGQRFKERGGSLSRKRFQRGQLSLDGQSWVARWREDIQTDSGVRRVRKSLVIGSKADYPTRKLAQRRLDLLLARVNSAGYRPGRIATVVEFAERWKSEVLCQLKPSTQMAAEGHLRKHIIPQVGSFRLDELAAERQQQFITRLSATVSRKTLLNILTTLSSMLGKAEAWGYVTATVNRKQLTLPRSERIRRRFFSAEEIRRIVAAAPEPLATICFLAATTGLREGEIFGLNVSDLDFERHTITVSRSAWRGKLQSPKSESSMRVLHMPNALAKLLKAYLSTWRPNSLDLLFASRRGTPINPNHLVARKLHPLLDKLKIERAGFHAFRHSHSSLLIELGAAVTSVQAQLGHSTPVTTLNVYSHVIPQSQRDSVERLAGILDGSGRKIEAKLLN